MYKKRLVTQDTYYVGASERRLALFENVYPLNNGVSYNSYLILDEKTCLLDSVDKSVEDVFIKKVVDGLNGRKLDYLVVNHMEPDHAYTLKRVIDLYPEVNVVLNDKTLRMFKNFNNGFEPKNFTIVKEMDQLVLGKHTLVFIFAPMVHWPEVMVSFDTKDGVLFSADAFGSFGALDGKLFNDEVNFDRDWIEDARRYYTNIVGKYGPHVQALLKKASTLDIKIVCPLHGPVWRSDLGYFIDKHDKWSRYEPEEKAVMIVYASMYGNTESAANALATKFVEKGVTNVVMYDVSNTHVSTLIAETFRVSHIVLASVTYNLGIYPLMHNYLMDMKALNVQNRTFALIENGSWATQSGKLMAQCLEGLKNIELIDDKLSLVSSMKEDNAVDMDALVDSVIESMNK